MDWLQKKGNTLRLCGRGHSAYMEGHSDYMEGYSDYMEGGSGLQPHLSYFPVISAKTSEVNELPIKTQVTSAHKEPKSHQLLRGIPRCNTAVSLRWLPCSTTGDQVSNYLSSNRIFISSSSSFHPSLSTFLFFPSFSGEMWSHVAQAALRFAV